MEPGDVPMMTASFVDCSSSIVCTAHRSALAKAQVRPEGEMSGIASWPLCRRIKWYGKGSSNYQQVYGKGTLTCHAAHHQTTFY